MKTEGIDFFGLGLYVLLCLFAIANIYSVEQNLGEKQLMWFSISVFIGIIIFLLRAKFFENLSPIFYALGVLLLAGLFPFGTEILGQKNWYKFGPISLQPVEFAKLAISLMLANYVSGPDFNIKSSKSLWGSLLILAIPGVIVLLIPDVGSLLVFLAFMIALYREGLSGWFFGVIFGLGIIFYTSLVYGSSPIIIFLAGALNTILIFYFNKLKPNFLIVFILLLITAGLAYISTISAEILQIVTYFIYAICAYVAVLFIIAIIKVVRKETNLLAFLKGFTILIIGGLIIALSFYAKPVLEKMPKHQSERIKVLYLGEKKFKDTSGYNLLYSKTAIGSGGFFGKGYKEGSVTQGKFVPEQETDYIFCTVGEEWGFFGSMMLILVYGLFIGRIYYLSEKQKSVFNRVFGYCFASILLMHFSINLGMVMGLFPTVGIPLPFFSYGGSSLLAFSVMTFIFFKLNYTDRNSLV